jgi:DNA polymerase-1
MPKLVLIDGHSLAYRAYHALPPSMQTTKGELTNAVYGFIATLLKIMKDERPDYLAVAFDVGRTFRDDMYTEYKGTRQSMPDDLSYQIARIDALVRAFNIPSLQLPGFEADDVLGTAARQAEQQGVDTVIYTGDTDAFQLVGPHTKVVVSRRQFGDLAVYDEAAVKERYGLEPKQLADFRGLKGDTSDNIPGVPGIGEKTATELLRKFGTVEGIYAHLDEVTAKRAREALAANKDKALLSRNLAVIVRDAPLTLDLHACRVNEYDPEAVKQILRELEIRSLMDKLPQPVAGVGRRSSEAQAAESETAAESGDQSEAAVPAPGGMKPASFGVGGEAAGLSPQGPKDLAASTPVRESGELAPVAQPVALDYQTVQDDAAFKKMMTRLRKARAIAVDTETTGQNALESELVGISLSIKDGQAWYVAIGHRASEQADMLSSAESQADDFRCLSLESVRAQLAPLFADPKIAKYGHNIKFDALVLAAHGMPLEGITFDTMVGAFLADPGSRHLGLKPLAFIRLHREMQDIVSLIGKGKDQITMAQVPVGKVSPYACADADVTHCLVGVLTPELKDKNAWALFTEIEMPLVPVLVGMEQAGVLLDVEFLARMKVDLDKRLHAIESDIYRAAGREFNINSTQQLGKVLFEELKLDASGAGKTKAGGYSTAVGVLEQLQGAHEVVDMVLEYRQLDKLQSTYVETLPVLVSKKDGRLHTSYNQTGAVTGRISSSDPNLQNIPIRTELGRQVRRAFVAPPGKKLMAADYSQVELRILAHLSQDPGLLDAFERDEDVHKATAAAIFGVPLAEVTPNMRGIAKTTNYAIVYGISGFGLAARTELSMQEAQQFILSYFEKYPGVKKYLDDTKETARTKGYVETLLGRRRYFPELQSRAGNYTMRAAAERMAINAPVQGTSADVMKIAMIRLSAAMQKKKMQSRMILQVHDELVFEAPDKEVKSLAKLVREHMCGAYELDVPLVVEVNAGPNWDDMAEV